MTLAVFKTLWGCSSDIRGGIEQALEAGFTGVEGPVPIDAPDFFRELGDTPWIAEVSTCTPSGEYLPLPHRTVVEHLASLEAGLLRCIPGGPLFVTSMAGSDSWGLDDCLRFYEGVLGLQEKHGTVISVETHRGRPTWNPWMTERFVVAFPELRLTCDFSHWCVVTERLVLDQEPILLEKIASHAHHIHGRVGYAQGPQVPDPRAPEYEAELKGHERWWDVLFASMRQRGMARATFTPEFGPDGYLQCRPFTLEPVADLWEINRWIGHRQMTRHSLL
ncbi:MAG: sugar phosphate isomerase/epimerase [Verrucomicrobia bacterium]|nr:MAG: sugar phosphate isomerase/epimerase [Verrucomicrobiota bacterium]TAE85658.1 MAG: sugar phosphate isomerase/epimerase [Verrucomicrobiota bacterium]TAF23260.1 MAG: sugar phosphate isomerase/epimerase [Verrucomicrobiota bacterium]